MMDRTITPDAAAEMLAQPGEVNLIDVRRREDFDTADTMLPGATWRDPQAVEYWIAELDPCKPTVIYCVGGGSVSNTIVDRLRATNAARQGERSEGA